MANNQLTARSIYDAAKRERMWIYFYKQRKWMDPEAFLQEYAQCHPDHPTLYELRLQCPIATLSKGYTQLINYHSRLAAFNERVAKYYGQALAHR